MDDSNSDAVDDESKTCKLIGGTFQSFLQLVLAIAALAALIVKRWREYPRRRPKIWIYDVSKQAVGGITMHAWNILFAMIITDFSTVKNAKKNATGGNDECAVYLVQLILDTIFGIVIMYVLLVAQEFLAKMFGMDSLAVSGNYGNPPSFIWYKHQLAAYMVIVFVSKTIVSILVLLLLDHVIPVGNALVTPFKKFPDMELVFVMIIMPYFLNSIFFWVMDNLLMASALKKDGGTGTPKSYDPIPPSRERERDDWSLATSVDINDTFSLRTPEPQWVAPSSHHSSPTEAKLGKVQPRLPAWIAQTARDL